MVLGRIYPVREGAGLDTIKDPSVAVCIMREHRLWWRVSQLIQRSLADLIFPPGGVANGNPDNSVES